MFCKTSPSEVVELAPRTRSNSKSAFGELLCEACRWKRSLRLLRRSMGDSKSVSALRRSASGECAARRYYTDRGTWTPTKHVHQNLNLICLPISSYPHMFSKNPWTFFIKKSVLSFFKLKRETFFALQQHSFKICFLIHQTKHRLTSPEVVRSKKCFALQKFCRRKRSSSSRSGFESHMLL